MNSSENPIFLQLGFYVRIALAAACAFASIAPPAYSPPLVFRVLALAAAGFAALVGLARCAKCSRRQAALVSALPLLPAAATVCAVVIFLVGGHPYLAPLASCLLALLLWSLAADSCSDFLTVDRCNQSSYGELKYRLTQLDPRLAEANARAARETDIETKAEMDASCKQASEQRANIDTELGTENRLAWVLATGYINLWKRLHRAEEALIEALPTPTVIAGALNDELRLIGSKMDNRDELLTKLRHAIIALDPCAVDFLKLSADESKALTAPSASGTPPPTAAVPATAAPAGAAAGSANSGDRQRLARPILRTVRRAINEYRDDRYDGLVVSRNRTLGAALFTGLTAFMLLGIAMIMGSHKETIVAGVTFYLVGATVGLLGRLRNESEADSDVADYGLSTARLFCTPLLCGLAAIGGVVLAATLPLLTGVLSTGTGTTPTVTHNQAGTSATAASETNSADATTLSPADSDQKPAPPKKTLQLVDVFDLQQNLVGVLVAAIFGLTPGLLFSRLQQQADQNKAELKSSEPSHGVRSP